MRSPSRSGKIQTAAKIASMIAAQALSRQSIVSIYPLALDKKLPPHHQTGGSANDVYSWILGAATLKPASNWSWETQEIESAGAVVYISDFYQENEVNLFDFISNTENEIGPSAGICIYSPAEFFDLGTGTIGTTWLPNSDRNEWVPNDLENIRRARMDYFVAHFESFSKGGLTIVSSDWDDQDFEMVLINSKLGEILKK
jgi:hypothetical protein